MRERDIKILMIDASFALPRRRRLHAVVVDAWFNIGGAGREASGRR